MLGIKLFLCANYTLNGLDNILYDMYSLIKSENALWEFWTKSTRMKMPTWKKFIVGKFLDFKIVDSKTFMS
jgi:hypothetical protein